MKHIVFALMISAASLTAHAQNLVPNPSFEEYLECPFSTAELDNQVVDWYSWQMTPDFFHSCSDEIDGFAGVPENVWGFQWPMTGEAYAALITFEDHNPNGREYVAAQLIEPLVVGQQYYMVFHTSLCDGGLNINRKCATNNLGMRFFVNPTYSYFPPDQSFHVDNFAHLNHGEIIADDDNWVKIEGWFTADDIYNWVAIGNFFDDDNTDTNILNDTGQCWGYYYIENICIASDSADCDELLSSNSRTEENNYLRVYPNPVSEELFVEVETGWIQALSLFDIQGKVIRSFTKLSSPSIKINVSNLQKGIYVLRIQINEEFFNHKIVVR